MRLSFGPFILDSVRGTLTRDGRLVPTNHKGIALLTALLRTPGEVVGKTTPMDAAWPGTSVKESNLSVQIAALRKLLGGMGDDGEWIVTVPRVGYRFAGSVSGADGSSSGPDTEARPLIAVLPFGIASDETGKGYLADGITADIITALARYRCFAWCAVWPSHSARDELIAQEQRPMHSARAMRCMAACGLRRSGCAFPCNSLTCRVARIFGPSVTISRWPMSLRSRTRLPSAWSRQSSRSFEKQIAHRGRPHSGNVTAWDLVRQGMWYFHKVTREGHRTARELFRRACDIDPELPEAHSWLGRVSAGLIAYGWTDDAGADGREGIAAATRAIVLDARDPYSHYAFAIACCYAGSANTAALAARSAIGINPALRLATSSLAWHCCLTVTPNVPSHRLSMA